MNAALDAILEIFTWVGLGSALLLGLVTLIVWAADGSWLPAQAVIEIEDGRTVLRWFEASGGVGVAAASPADAAELAGKRVADIWYRHGTQGRMRLSRRSPAVRAVGLLALGFAGLGAAAGLVSWILLFARG